MCGIGCVWFRESVDVEILEKMLEATEKRGKDAFGYAIIRYDKTEDDYVLFDINRYGKSYSEIKQNINLFTVLKVGDIIIWNNRAKPMTEFSSVDGDDRTIQPIWYRDEGIIMVHNGVVSNEDEKFKRRTKIDSEFFIHRYLKNGRNIKKTAEEMIGGSAYIYVDLRRDILGVVRDFRPLGKAYKKGVGYFVMTDTDEFYNVFGDMDVAIWENFYYSNIQQFTTNEVDLNSGLINRKEFEPNYISSLPEQDPNKVLVMSSGGVDSSVAACVAAKLLRKEVTLVHFDIKQKNNPGEIRAVNYLREFLRCRLDYVDLRWLGSYGKSVLTDNQLKVPSGSVKSNLKNTVCWVPARNLIMLSCLMGVAEAIGASEIYNGFTQEEGTVYNDNSTSFFNAMNYVSDFGTLKRPKVKTILGNLMKPEVIKLGWYFGLDFSQLWSCDTYNEKTGKECGECGACTLKALALEHAKQLDRPPEEIINRLKY